MKKVKPLFVLSALAFASSSMAGNVAVYGYLDAGIQNADPKAGAAKTQLVSGLLAPNTLGFKSSEDLGNGLSAHAVLENRFEVVNGALSNGNGNMFNVAKVGIAGEQLGQLNLGRTVDAFWGNGLAKFDVTAGGNMGSAVDTVLYLQLSPVFQSNTVQYVAPGVGGFNGAVTYALKDNTNTQNDRYSLAATYESGALSVGAGYAKHDGKGYFAGAGYDFGVAKANVVYLDAESVTTGENSKAWGINGAVPMGATTITAAYYDYDRATAGNGEIAQLGAQYALSKRTRLFANYQHATGSVGLNYGSTAGSNTNGTVIVKDPGSAVTFGVGHSF